MTFLREPYLLKYAKLRNTCCAFGISAVRVLPKDWQQGSALASDIDGSPRPEGGPPRFVGPEDARGTGGILVWGQDPAVNAGLQGLQVAMDGVDEVVLQLGPSITDQLSQDDLTRVWKSCKGGGYKRVSNITRFGTLAFLCYPGLITGIYGKLCCVCESPKLSIEWTSL